MGQGRTNRKVLLPLYYYHPYVSGVSVYAKRLAEGLVKSGYQVTVLTARFDKNLPKLELINGVKVLRRPVLFKFNKGVVMPTFWLDIVRYSLKYDYVNPHLPLAESGLASLLIPKEKIVTTYQCDISLGNGLIAKIVASLSFMLMRLQLMRSKVVVPLSLDYFENSKMKAFLAKAHPVNPPISANEFHRVDPTPLRKKLKLGSADMLIGFVGRIVSEKGINYLLESIQHLQKHTRDFKIIIAGDYEKVAGGSIKNELNHYIARYPDKILFTGFLNDHELVQFYSLIDVLVLPSIDPLEAFGMVQVEAMLCGAPVVATDRPGVRVVIQRTGYGRLCEPRNSQDLANQIFAIITQPRKYKPDRQRVIKTFDEAQTIKDYISLMP